MHKSLNANQYQFSLTPQYPPIPIPHPIVLLTSDVHQRKTKHFIAKFFEQPFMVLQTFLKSVCILMMFVILVIVIIIDRTTNSYVDYHLLVWLMVAVHSTLLLLTALRIARLRSNYFMSGWTRRQIRNWRGGYKLVKIPVISNSVRVRTFAL